jgi:hypothetical protein
MIKRIPISALKVGMYITDLNNDSIPHNPGLCQQPVEFKQTSRARWGKASANFLGFKTHSGSMQRKNREI